MYILIGMLDYDVIMNSPDQRKPSSVILISLIAAGILILLLAVSVGQIRLDEGYLIPIQSEGADGVNGNASVGNGEIWTVILRGLMGLALVALPVYVIQSLFSKKGRQQLLANLIVIGLVFLLIRVVENQDDEELVVEAEPTGVESSEPLDIDFVTIDGKPLPELPEEAPAWVNTLILILGGVVVVGLVAAIYVVIQRLRKKKVPDALDRVADQAQNALHKIRSGGDFNSAILSCYYEMNRIIREELKLTRQYTMTARDFETYLVNKGLPQRPINQLTALFERARYSNQSPDATQEDAAVEALTALIESVHQLAPEEEGTA